MAGYIDFHRAFEEFHTRSGFMSEVTTTETTLGAGGVWESDGEDITAFSSLSICVFADQDSANLGCKLQVSMDNVTWHTVREVTLEASVLQIHTYPAIAQFFRMQVTNGATAQGSFCVATKRNIHQPHGLVGGTEQILEHSEDAGLVRPVSNFEFDANAGRIAHTSMVHKFGHNLDIGTAVEYLWTEGGIYNWLTAADSLQIRSGGDAADDAAGLGAQSIWLEGLDTNMNPLLVEEDTNGALASGGTTEQFFRLNRLWVGGVGAYGAPNTGKILVETAGGILVGAIPAGLSRSGHGFYSVPAGKTAYIRLVHFNVDSNKSVTFDFFMRPSADNTGSAPYGPMQRVGALDGVNGPVEIPLEAWPALPEKSDLWIQANTVSGTASASAYFDITLVDNT